MNETNIGENKMTNVKTLKANGYKVWETGGGCTSWGFDFENGKTVLIGRDCGHDVELDSEYNKLNIRIGAMIQTEQGDFINVESKENNVLQLINFVKFLNDMDNEAFQELADFQPQIIL